MASKKRQREEAGELIVELCVLVPGVGEITAGAVAEDFDANFGEFIKADKDRLQNIVSSKDRRILTDNQIYALMSEKSIIPADISVTNAWVLFLGKRFLLDAIENLQSYTLDTLDINPLLVKVLDLKTPEQIIEFNLYQSVTRSVVTSWGSCVEKLLIHCGAEPFLTDETSTKGNKLDIQIQNEGVEYLFQIKSGPNTMNVGMIQSLNKVIEDYRAKKPQSRVLLGMTYGRRDMISPQIMGNLQDVSNSTKIGRELWDFISGETDFHKKIFVILDQASHGVMKGTFTDLMRDKLTHLIKEWKTRHGNTTADQILDQYM